MWTCCWWLWRVELRVLYSEEWVAKAQINNTQGANEEVMIWKRSEDGAVLDTYILGDHTTARAQHCNMTMELCLTLDLLSFDTMRSSQELAVSKQRLCCAIISGLVWRTKTWIMKAHLWPWAHGLWRHPSMVFVVIVSLLHKGRTPDREALVMQTFEADVAKHRTMNYKFEQQPI